MSPFVFEFYCCEKRTILLTSKLSLITVLVGKATACHWILFTHSHQLQGIQHAAYSFTAQFLVLNLLIFAEINFSVVFKL